MHFVDEAMQLHCAALQVWQSAVLRHSARGGGGGALVATFAEAEPGGREAREADALGTGAGPRSSTQRSAVVSQRAKKACFAGRVPQRWPSQSGAGGDDFSAAKTSQRQSSS
jgi:hypothetical protein